MLFKKMCRTILQFTFVEKPMRNRFRSHCCSQWSEKSDSLFWDQGWIFLATSTVSSDVTYLPSSRAVCHLVSQVASPTVNRLDNGWGNQVEKFLHSRVPIRQRNRVARPVVVPPLNLQGRRQSKPLSMPGCEHHRDRTLTDYAPVSWTSAYVA
jgi:hypothetical protein